LWIDTPADRTAARHFARLRYCTSKMSQAGTHRHRQDLKPKGLSVVRESVTAPAAVTCSCS